MIKQKLPKVSEHVYQPIITVSADELKGIFGDNDLERLEYPASEFPMPQTRIIMVFNKQSGKAPQYLELEEWFDLIEDYKESQQQLESLRNLNNYDLNNHNHTAADEHGEEFVCIISFQINGDDNNIRQAVVKPEDRNDCVDAILDNHPNDHLDFSIEFMCKQCFEEMMNEQRLEELGVGTYGSSMIH